MAARADRPEPRRAVRPEERPAPANALWAVAAYLHLCRWSADRQSPRLGPKAPPRRPPADAMRSSWWLSNSPQRTRAVPGDQSIVSTHSAISIGGITPLCSISVCLGGACVTVLQAFEEADFSVGVADFREPAAVAGAGQKAVQGALMRGTEAADEDPTVRRKELVVILDDSAQQRVLRGVFFDDVRAESHHAHIMSLGVVFVQQISFGIDSRMRDAPADQKRRQTGERPPKAAGGGLPPEKPRAAPSGRRRERFAKSLHHDPLQCRHA